MIFIADILKAKVIGFRFKVQGSGLTTFEPMNFEQ
jgi:hypothetical protein